LRIMKVEEDFVYSMRLLDDWKNAGSIHIWQYEDS